MLDLTTINETDPVSDAPAVLNDNFATLNTGKLETLTNDGAGAGQLVEAPNGQNVNIKTLVAGSNISLTNGASTVTITANAPNSDASTTTEGLTRLSASPSVTLGNPTITIASPAVVTLTGHGLTVNDEVQFSTNGSLPTGITAATTYYVLSSGLTTNTFEISATAGGSAITTTGSQSGTHTLVRVTPVALSTTDPLLSSPNSGTALNSSTNPIEDKDDTSATSSANKLIRANGSGLLDNSFLQSNIALRIKIATNCEYPTDRFTTSQGNGVASFGTTGASLTTSSTASGWSYYQWNALPGANATYLTAGSIFSANFSLTTIGTTGVYYIGLGAPQNTANATFTATVTHIGFKVAISGGVATLYGSQADGSTEDTVSLGTIAAGDDIDCFFEIGASSVTYYWRKNGGTLASATLSSNIPASLATNAIQLAINNLATATASVGVCGGMAFER